MIYLAFLTTIWEKMMARVLKSFVLTKQVGKDPQFGPRCIRLREQEKLP